MLDIYTILVIGILISIIFYELTDISPGGIIVPGLLVTYINSIERVIFTVIIALLTYLIVKFLSKYVLVFGKRRFALMIIISIFLSIIFELITHALSGYLLSVSIVGYTIAGLIANDFYKQGVKKTLPALAICVCLLELIVIIGYQLGV
jgi:poly-gamma-glutamate biosynthesis protein PgsC/CapC